MIDITVKLRSKSVVYVKAQLERLHNIRDNRGLSPSEELVIDDVITMYEEFLPPLERKITRERIY